MRHEKVLLCLGGFVLLALTFSGCALFNFGGTKLVDVGKPCADIVIAEKPPRMVKLAAEELQAYVEKISGAKLAITNAPNPDVPAHIYVGRSAETDKLKITDEGLEHGAFKMVSGENWLALVGHDSDYTPPMPYYGGGGWAAFPAYLKIWDADVETRAQHLGFKLEGEKWYPTPGSVYSTWREHSKEMGIWEKDERGSLNAVYAFLRDLGIRWYLPGELGEIVPKKNSIEIPLVDKTVRPDFAIRYFDIYFRHFANTSRDQTLWQLRMGLSQAPELVGNGGGICHGIGNVIGREETKQAHPEYYKLMNGKRITADSGVPCLSSPGLFASNVKYVRALFELYNEPMVSVMMTDGMDSICQCELCKDKGASGRGSEGFASDYVWDYVNRVAREVYKTNPDKLISCAAYTPYRLLPTNITQLSPNIVVELAQTRSCELNDYVDPKRKEQILSLRNEWLQKVPKGHTPFFIYDYYREGFNAPFMSPWFFPHTIAADLHSLKGISLGDYIEVYSGGLSKSLGEILGVTFLNLYVTAQFLWDADQDVDKLLDEYYTLFYGPAAAEMKAFVDYCETNMGSLEKNADKLGQAFALLDKAQGKVAPESVYAKRIALIADNMRPMQNLLKQLGRGPVPAVYILERGAKDLKLDGKLDDAFWQGIESYELVDVETGRRAGCRTFFKMGYASDNLYIGIECKGASKVALTNTTPQHDSQSILEGEDVEIMLETQTHSYYNLAISPGGGLFDADCKKGLDPLWNSNAEVSTRIDGDSWSVEIRIPIVPPTQEDIQPMIGVAGNKPIQSYPWYFNVCRQGFGEKGHEMSAFSPTGAGFQVPMMFAKLYVR